MFTTTNTSAKLFFSEE